MQIQEIVLKDFRNYQNLSLSFSPVTNFIVGPNGAGKTNILEAITILSNLRSFRNSHDSEIIRWGNFTYYCACTVVDCLNNKFEVAYNNESGVQRKKYQIDGNVIKTHSEYYGKLLTVVLSPSDIQLIQGAPDIRRKYFDSIISKYDFQYLLSLNDFRKSLFNRNKLLKIFRERGSIDRNEIEIWDHLFAEKASYITAARMNFVNNYNVRFMDSYRAISDENNIPFLRYKPSIDCTDSDSIIQELRRLRTKEIIFGATLKGPQRDDFYFENNKNILFTHFASQGQRRTAAIALKISERDYIQNYRKEKCIILIDDIFSELDTDRQKNMVTLLNDANQMLFTMVNSSSYIIDKLNMERLFFIERNGLIIKQ